MSIGVKIKPFLKWAGGKGQLLSEIASHYPFEDRRITKYAEPFVGGGAVLFDVLNRFELDAVYISDINKELVETYKAIRNDVESLIAMLSKLQSTYNPYEHEIRQALYSEKRERFNQLKIEGKSEDYLERSALMIFLNRTCFNGLYRVNKKGLFNVPMGKYKNPLICDEVNLQAISEKLQNVEIIHGDYKQSADFIDEKTFVYFDPPYRPLTTTSSFTAYTEYEFEDEEQVELAKFVDAMSKRGAKILVSNSDPTNVDSRDDFFDRIYGGHKISRVEASRMINSKGTGRGKIRELLISNF